MTKEKNTIENLIIEVKKYLQVDTKVLLDAYELSKKYLDSKLEKETLETAFILTTVYADIETITASLLYKLLSLEKVSEKDLLKYFDESIVKITKGAFKLAQIIYSTENEYLIEYYKKIIVGMTEDVRVIMINLASRVTLMRNINEFKPTIAKKLAKESLEIVAPIAHHLGIYKLKSELEDLSLKTLKPEVYNDIVEKLNSTKNERDNLIKKMTIEVKELLDSHGINYEIKGRSKSIYSIYNKLDKGRKFNDIYDLFALRIMVSDESLCYLVLGLIHSKFRPIPKRFKDFIAMPKSNGYRSLHTTVFGVDNTLFEIQIRTFLMNEVAENGLAAHWSYKENRKADNLSSTDQKLEFFKTVIDNYQNKVDTGEVIEEIKDTKMHGNIYVFTPKGDVIELPHGATPIDFAYRVHTKVGESMVGAIVNNEIVPLNYVLEDNDVVKINTSKQSTGPKLSWLKIAKLTQTKNKIKSYFQKERKDEIIKYGENSLDSYLRKKHISKKEFLTEDNVSKILKELKCKDLTELYLNIGNNKYTPHNIVSLIYPNETPKILKKEIIIKNNRDINVAGIDNIKVNIASCCNPIPGDKIVGFITKNNGITVHNVECFNVRDNDRLIDVKWQDETNGKYLTKIRILTNSSTSYLGDLINKLTSLGLVINNIRTSIIDMKYNFEISFRVSGIKEIDNIIKSLMKLGYVTDVWRVFK